MSFLNGSRYFSWIWVWDAKPDKFVPVVIPSDRFKIKKNYHNHLFFRLHSTTQTLTTHAHSHPYEHKYANPTPMSIFDD